ncbi:MAG: LL-diaminopimelate aminotransferase [Candidatus Omnitrophica bacterium]|nr:LL-diaminopimelate aminotransferase [Candidatus Omnitrophota bacterium]
MWKQSERMDKLPPYLFAEIDRKRKILEEKGREVISFGIGDPDIPTPKRIVDAMKKALDEPSVFRYPLGKGRKDFRKSISQYYKKNYDVSLDYDKEIAVLIGSKEGLAHFPEVFVNPGEFTLVPEPAYPVYKIGTYLAGGTPYLLPLEEKNRFEPQLGSIPQDVLGKAKLLYLNYPNNPTSACATKEFLSDAINFCKKWNIILVYDAAYQEIYYDGKKPVSFFSIPGAKDVGIEFHSLSKTYNMTGWRIGWACGNKEIVSKLAILKENIDSGTFEAIQLAGIEALSGPQDDVHEIRGIYQERRDILVEGLKKLSFNVKIPEATFYVWLNVGSDGVEWTTNLLEKAGIIVTPGLGFGPSGKRFVRFALTIPKEKIQQALVKMESLWKK